MDTIGGSYMLVTSWRERVNNNILWQCRSKNIICAFLVTAHIVHKAVVVSLRKIFWWNGFIIFITGKSSTKLHVTHFLDLSLQAFHLNLAQWIKVTLTQRLAFTNGVKFYTFLVLFFPCKIPMPIYFYGISIFSLLSAIQFLWVLLGEFV